ncbi:MAG: GTPase HflX, partial [Candidatus Dormibacteria bacterium]
MVAVDLHDPARPLAPELSEFEALIEAAGATIVDRVVQRLPAVDPATLVGSGKAREIAELAVERTATSLFVFNDLRPRQRTNLEKIVPIGIVDRTMVILDVFAQRARSREGKLQVELAQLRYRQANLIGVGAALSRLGGGIGTRGPGETKLEVDRRRIQARVSTLRGALEDVRTARVNRRAPQPAEPLVALVGYTNAGKSSLLNRLAPAGGEAGAAFVADQPFATLDPTTRRIYLAAGRFARLTDTVGFITELPKELVNAFRATLEELAQADLLVHVIDAANP